MSIENNELFLIKPKDTEIYNIAVFNQNSMDIETFVNPFFMGFKDRAILENGLTVKYIDGSLQLANGEKFNIDSPKQTYTTNVTNIVNSDNSVTKSYNQETKITNGIYIIANFNSINGVKPISAQIACLISYYNDSETTGYQCLLDINNISVLYKRALNGGTWGNWSKNVDITITGLED